VTRSVMISIQAIAPGIPSAHVVKKEYSKCLRYKYPYQFANPTRKWWPFIVSP
jgi:hypothetical protein